MPSEASHHPPRKVSLTATRPRARTWLVTFPCSPFRLLRGGPILVGARFSAQHNRTIRPNVQTRNECEARPTTPPNLDHNICPTCDRGEFQSTTVRPDPRASAFEPASSRSNCLSIRSDGFTEVVQTRSRYRGRSRAHLARLLHVRAGDENRTRVLSLGS